MQKQKKQNRVLPYENRVVTPFMRTQIERARTEAATRGKCVDVRAHTRIHTPYLISRYRIAILLRSVETAARIIDRVGMDAATRKVLEQARDLIDDLLAEEERKGGRRHG
jgi:hypothetical protein